MFTNNNAFWIFADNIQETYNLNTYKRENLISGIHSLFSNVIVPVGGTVATVHAPEYYEDDDKQHTLAVALGLVERNMDNLIQTQSPIQGTGTGIIIDGCTVYHATGTYNRKNFDGICTLFYTFNSGSKIVTIHAIGAHKDDSYYLDCASSAFDTAVRQVGALQWGYRLPGVIRLH